MKSIISRLIFWNRGKVKAKISYMYPPPPPRHRIADILARLNQEMPGWIELPGYHCLTVPKLTAPNITDFNFPNMGLVLKCFYNGNTGEIRTYVAKLLDIPHQDRVILWANDPQPVGWPPTFLPNG